MANVLITLSLPVMKSCHLPSSLLERWYEALALGAAFFGSGFLAGAFFGASFFAGAAFLAGAGFLAAGLAAAFFGAGLAAGF